MLPALAALVGGVAISFQAVVLAGLGRSAGSLRAGLLTYAAGGMLALVCLGAMRVVGMTSGGASSPAAGWLQGASAGALGIGILASLAYSTGRITVAAGLAMMLVGQMAAAVLLDAAGMGGSAPVAFDLRRAAGILLLGVGAYLLLPRP
jgi:bacterial/archaeal transporter family-2 protein